MNIFLTGLQGNDMDMMKAVSKIITNAIRADIQDLQAKYLSNEQTLELNPLIRNAVYNALFALANYDIDDSCKEFVSRNLTASFQHPEDVSLYTTFAESFDNLLNKQIVFNSEFLNEQYKTGNIYFVPLKKCIQLLGSSEFIGVPYNERKKHKSKITYQLNKEGYIYDWNKDGYVKQ